MGEFDLIRQFFLRPSPCAVSLEASNGDDCTLLPALSGNNRWAITTDMLNEGVHFLADTDPQRLGWKVVAVNLSDLAAMGAKPRFLQLALSLPQVNIAWLSEFARGLWACADEFGVHLSGGDTTRGPLAFCVTAFGEVPLAGALFRHRAQVGDDIWVSGTPGLAALGLRHLTGQIHLAHPEPCIDALEKPMPRIALGLALQALAMTGEVHAAIDISDGLAADLGHILSQSAVAADINALPVRPAWLADCPIADWQNACLSGGDDYELCFTAISAARQKIVALSQQLDLAIGRIGQIKPLFDPTQRLHIVDNNGQILHLNRSGFVHF